MKYCTISKKLEKINEVEEQCTLTLKNGCTCVVSRWFYNGTHHAILYAPNGEEIETQGGMDETDVEVFVSEAEARDEFDTDDWDHDEDY